MKQQIRDWLELTWAAMTLKPAPFQYFASDPVPLRQAVALILAVGLLVGGIQAVVQLPTLLQPTSFDADVFLQELDKNMPFNQMFGGAQSPEMQQLYDMYRSGVEAFAPQISRLLAVPAPLPAWVGRLLSWLAMWLSTPFALFARWLGLSLWIMLAARVLGGKGTLLSYLGASSLSVLPHLLRTLSFIPLVGGLLVFLAGIWGLIIQVRAVEITHQMPQNRAVLAVLSPFILGLVILMLLGVLALIILILATAGGS